MKYLIAFGHLLVCSLISFCLASILHTQAVLAKLTKVDVAISLNERLNTTITDLFGLAPLYGGAILFTLILAFSIAGLVNKKLKLARHILYPVAAAIGFYIMLVVMYSLLNATIIAGARGLSGQVLQISAGIIGGVIFATLREKVHRIRLS